MELTLRNARRTRRLIAALLLAAAAFVRLADIVATIRVSDQTDSCYIEFFGITLRPTATSCYLPIGDALLVVLTLLAAAVGLAVGPRLVVGLVTLAAAGFALAAVPEALGQDHSLSSITLSMSLLAAVPFVVVAPVGRSASPWARRAWILALLGCTALGLFDMLVSGVFAVTPPAPQVAFVIIGLTILGAGLLSGNLERGRASEAPAITA